MTLDFDSFIQWTTKTPKLQYLFIMNVVFTTSVQEKSRDKSLARLEQCMINDSQLTSDQLVTLLVRAPNIKKLKLNVRTSYLDKLDLPVNYFPFLESLELLFTDLLPTFFKAAPNCQKLTLFLDDKLVDLKRARQILPSERFGSLKKLDVSNEENMPFEILEYLLMMFPNIEELNLDDTFFSGIKFNLLPNSLPYLSELLLSVSVREDFLDELCAAAPRLKKDSFIDLIESSSDEDSEEESEEESVEEESQAAKPVSVEMTECIWDADTRPTHPTYNIQPIFFPEGHEEPVDPRLYRLNVFHYVQVTQQTCDVLNAFRIVKVGDLSLSPVPDVSKKSMKVDEGSTDNKLYRGRKKILLTKSWQALPSLSAREQLIDYQVEPKVAVELQYSNRDSLYYIRHTGEEDALKVALEWVISVPKATSPEYQKGIKDLIFLIQNYKEGSLNLPEKPQTGQEYLSAIVEQQKGACRHRALAFKHLMHQQFPHIPVRIIVNDCHAFVEIGILQQWFTCDLGGYSARINLLQSLKSDARKPFKADDFDPDDFGDTEVPELQTQLINALCCALEHLNQTQQSRELKNLTHPGMMLAYAEIMLLPQQWQTQIVQPILAWNGSKEQFTGNTYAALKKLYDLSMAYECKKTRLFYLGDKLKIFLSNLNQSCVLYNPWIGCHIQRTDTQGQWLVFDGFGGAKQQVTQKDLYEEIINRLGPIVSIQADEDPSVTLKDAVYIQDAQQFVEEGGVLILSFLQNRAAVVDEYFQRTSIKYTKKALGGLFLRQSDEVPAWVLALGEKETYKLILELLGQWIELEKDDDWESTLLSDLEALEPEFRARVIQLFKRNLKNEPKPGIAHQKLYSLLTHQDYVVYFNRKMPQSKKPPSGWKEYCQTLLEIHPRQTKKLIELKSSKDLKALRFGLEKIAKTCSRPLFYVHTAEDLMCMSPFILRSKTQVNQGVLHKGPGGPLYDFIQANQNTSPVLVVNYENFSADEIVSFNDLVDKKRTIQGVNVPEKTLVIGLLNIQKEGCYQGSDFYSRFDEVEPCTIASTELQKSIEPLVFIEPGSVASKVPSINLFHHQDWKNKLLGSWVLSGQSLCYQEGALSGIFAKSELIEIQNGLWENEEFLAFWQQAMLRQEIYYHGMIYKLPSNVKIIKRDGYDWSLLKQNLIIDTKLNEQQHLLNPECLRNYFRHDEFDQSKKCMDRVQGLIEAAKSKILCVYVSSELDEDDWAELLTECLRFGVTLKAHVAPSIRLPANLGLQVAVKELDQPTAISTLDSSQKTVFIESTDIDATVAQLNTDDKQQFLIIDISESKAAHLLKYTQCVLNQETGRFEFSQTYGLLYDAIESSKNLILKGNFSDELIQQLGVKLLERMQHLSPKGRWIFVTSQARGFSPFGRIYAHRVTVDEKLKLLQCNPAELEVLRQQLLTQASLSELQARLCILRTRRNTSSDKAWEGMRTLAAPNFSELGLDLDTASAAAQWTQDRFNAISAQLKVYPYVFLTGLSGVGKSTFVLKELSKTCSLHHGESSILSWIQDKSSQYKILFIDEANLSPREWSEFEGLFQNPPRILVENQLYDLTASHKVIFAGNPTSYGDERRLASLFERRGGALLFQPLPGANLYEEILKPLFVGYPDSAKILAVCKYIIQFYYFFVKYSTTDVLISPRELEMIALLTLSYAKLYPKEDIQTIVKFYAYQIGKTLVPQIAIPHFERDYKVPTLPYAIESTGGKEFLITPSRQNVYRKLHDCLTLASWRKEDPRLNTSQKFGGLGGIILEGSPGMGKSELVLHVLAKLGFEEVRLDKPMPKKPFYKIPVNLSHREKQLALLKAFDEGAIVMVDEINSGTLMERLLNDLLMGRAPDGKRPKSPGFMVIGTQNPASMAGRRTPSTALSRRMLTDILPDYLDLEMHEILNTKSVSILEIRPLVRAFMQQRTLAQTMGIQPLPSFRELLHVADRMFKPVVASPPLSRHLSIFHSGKGQKRSLESRVATSGELQDQALKFQRILGQTSVHEPQQEPDRVQPDIKHDLLFLEWLQIKDKELASLFCSKRSELSVSVYL